MQVAQKGKTGISLVSNWFIPFSRSKADKHAATRAVEFMLGW
jgi:beta-glucosidase